MRARWAVVELQPEPFDKRGSHARGELREPGRALRETEPQHPRPGAREAADPPQHETLLGHVGGERGQARVEHGQRLVVDAAQEGYRRVEVLLALLARHSAVSRLY